MWKQTVVAAALAGAYVVTTPAASANEKELAGIRAQIAQMKKDYDARLSALEQRLQEAQAALAQAQNAAAEAGRQQAGPSPPPVSQPPQEPTPIAAAQPGANAFNPAISVVLAGTYANLSRDPTQFRIRGFPPSDGDVGPGRRSFNLGESEITMLSNIDPLFSGQLTLSVNADNEISVEEGFMRTRSLGHGLNIKAGRFLSSLGYLNSQHAHAWDFVDAPLAYQAVFGGQYAAEGVQLSWLAPSDTFVELAAEFGSGRQFPGNDRNKNGLGATTVIGHVGGDLGDSGSWRAGLSWLDTGANDRSYEENAVSFAFTGRSRVLVADAIYKWAPNGNPTERNLKLQGEYLRRKEDGSFAAGDGSSGYRRTQSGWYLQAVYQFMPSWRFGVRYDHLLSGTPHAAVLATGAFDAALFPSLSSSAPSRGTAMLDWSPTEFSRLRLQFARDKSRPGDADDQLYVQYIMSMGTHAAHAF